MVQRVVNVICIIVAAILLLGLAALVFHDAIPNRQPDPALERTIHDDSDSWNDTNP